MISRQERKFSRQANDKLKDVIDEFYHIKM